MGLSGFQFRSEKGFMKALGRDLQHYSNPLHVYCRLRDLGIPKAVAISLCRFYEFALFRHFWGIGEVQVVTSEVPARNMESAHGRGDAVGYLT